MYRIISSTSAIKAKGKAINQHPDQWREKVANVVENEKKRKVDMAKYIQDKTRNHQSTLKELKTTGNYRERREEEMQSRFGKIMRIIVFSINVILFTFFHFGYKKHNL